MNTKFHVCGGLFLLLFVLACDAQEASRIELELLVSAEGTSARPSDLGYEIQWESVRLALENFEFTVRGEEHVSRFEKMRQFLVADAHAHPGHYQGGEVTGELRGEFLIDFLEAPLSLGRATLLPGVYESVDFELIRAHTGLVDQADPLLDHTARLSGRAVTHDQSLTFEVVIDAPTGRKIMGAPFRAMIDEQSTATIEFSFATVDPLGTRHFFDGIDFASLAEDGHVYLDDSLEGEALEAFFMLRRRFQSHDHFYFETRDEG